MEEADWHLVLGEMVFPDVCRGRNRHKKGTDAVHQLASCTNLEKHDEGQRRKAVFKGLRRLAVESGSFAQLAKRIGCRFAHANVAIVVDGDFLEGLDALGALDGEARILVAG